MTVVELAEAQGKLGELIDRVARGETVEILRDGTPVAQLTRPERLERTVKKQPIDFERLRILRQGIPPQNEDPGTFVRRMRDDERY